MKGFVEKLIERLKSHAAYNGKMLEKFPNMGEIENTIYRTQKDVYESSIRIVNQLAEEYKGGWIPCSESLPRDVMMCWATIEEKQVRFVRKLRYYPMCDKWVHDNGQGISEHAKVIAWMEYKIPVPYEEGE